MFLSILKTMIKLYFSETIEIYLKNMISPI